MIAPAPHTFATRVEMSVDGWRQMRHVYEVTIGDDLPAKSPPSDITITTPLTLKSTENDNSSLFEWLRGTSSDGALHMVQVEAYG